MACEIHPLGSLREYKYVVTLSFSEGKIVLSRHRERTTWETQGGHVEPGETPLSAARRELWEESGALDYTLTPLCDYRCPSRGPASWANGQVFVAQVRAFGPLPDHEMAEIRAFDTLPDNLTYPAITPCLFAQAARPR